MGFCVQWWGSMILLEHTPRVVRFQQISQNDESAFSSNLINALQQPAVLCISLSVEKAVGCCWMWFWFCDEINSWWNQHKRKATIRMALCDSNLLVNFLVPCFYCFFTKWPKNSCNAVLWWATDVFRIPHTASFYESVISDSSYFHRRSGTDSGRSFWCNTLEKSCKHIES